MKELREIKSKLKNINFWKKYQEIFSSKKTRFIFSKIVLIYEPSVDIDWLVEQEIKILSAPKIIDMFSDYFQEFKIKFNRSENWYPFGQFIFFIYQTSTFWKDKKKGIPNIFTTKDPWMLNQEKRNLYYEWLNSFDKSDPNFNDKLIKVLKYTF